ncbi:MAG TPA: hypothetical protein VHG28_14785 [Longimicrobiaceae bacterium]|nr:hypothetical protein [Longimicrobiaceae bacterium]
MRKWNALLLLGLVPGACDLLDREPPGTLPRERFIEVNVALRTLKLPVRDSMRTRADSARARADSARARTEVLRRFRVTEKDLQGYVDANRNDTRELSETWSEIATRVQRADSIARADSLKKANPGAKPDSARRDTLRGAVPRPAPPTSGPPPPNAYPDRNTVRRGPARPT